jgi:cytidylate kinase
MSFIVAIDGPAASGKGTIARRIAARFNFSHLDTGMLYRAVAAVAIEQKRDLKDETVIATVARALCEEDLHRNDLRSHGTGIAASVIATHRSVRAELLAFQRLFAANPKGGRCGAVLDGRDIATVVCPEAQVKIFVDADLAERANRRHKEARKRGEPASLADIQSDLAERDQRDAARASAPMKVAEAACLLDTTNLDIEEAVAAAAEFVEIGWNAFRAPPC